MTRSRLISVGALALLSTAVACAVAQGGSPAVQMVRAVASVPPADRATLHGRVAYSSHAGDIWVMDADGRHRARVTRSGRGEDFDPSWEPNARAVVFRTSRGRYVADAAGIGLEGIFVVDLETRRERQLQPRTGGLFPAWSPDGALIAFSGLGRRHPGDTIHVMTPGGTRIRDLGGARGGAQESTAWSPDGRRIAYSHHDGDGNWALWVMSRDGTHKRRLTSPEPVEPAGSGGDHAGAWSPDGSRIVYSGGQFADRELYVVGSDGTGAYRLTDWDGAVGAVVWLESGEIVFAHFAPDATDPEWYMVDADGANLRSLPWFAGAGDPLDWVQPR